MEIVGVAMLVVFAAAAGEGLIEFLIAPLVELLLPLEGQLKLRTFINNLVSAVLGVLLGIGFNLRAFGLLGGAEVIPHLDNIITGLLIGRGSNWVHELFKRFLTTETPKWIDVEEMPEM